MKYDTYGKRAPQETQGFKSKLEYITSKWLTKHLGLKVFYEPFTFKTKIGNYTPDFYCEETNQYFECKPNLEFAATHLYKQFCLEKKADLIIMCPEKIYCIEYAPEITEPFLEHAPWIWDDYECTLTCCHKCGAKSFATEMGSYHCRKCKTHEGDHDNSSAYYPSAKQFKEYIPFKEYYDSFKNRYGVLVIE